MMMIIMIICLQAMGVVELNDGSAHDVDYVIKDEVRLDYESSNLEATTLNVFSQWGYVEKIGGWKKSIVNVFDSGSVDHINGWENSVVNIFNGYVGRLDVYDNSQASVSVGPSTYPHQSWCRTNSLNTYNKSQLAFSNGLSIYVNAHGNSQIVISNKAVVVWGMAAYDDSRITISGGVIGQVNDWCGMGVCENSQVIVSGGVFNENYGYYIYVWDYGQVDISGGTFEGAHLGVSGNGAVTIRGYDFAIHLGRGVYVPVDNYTELGSLGYKSGGLVGTLDSGDFFYTSFRIKNDGRIFLIPEPYCIEPIPSDTNDDCKVDLVDFAALSLGGVANFGDLATMCSHWLECNLQPQSACWNK